MIELVKTGLSFLLQLSAFFLIGDCLMKIMKMKQDISMAVIVGYLAYFSIFEIIAVPMILLRVPLKIFSLAWGVFLIFFIFIMLFRLRKQQKGIHLNFQNFMREHSWLILLNAAVILVQCVIVVLYQDMSADSAYYVGTVSTSVYTGTMFRYNPYTGNPLRHFQARYVFSAYPMHNAVWCWLLGVHPIIQSKVIMSVINIVVSNLVFYQIGKRLFNQDRKKADLMVATVCLLQLFTNTIYTPGRFLFTRSYEGKAILANIAVPVVIYCCLWLWQKEEKNLWIVIFLASVSGICFSGSAFILIAGIAAGVIPVICKRKKLSKMVPMCICILPEIFYLVLYYSAKMGWLVLKAY